MVECFSTLFQDVFLRQYLFSLLTKNPSFIWLVLPFDLIVVLQNNCAQLDTFETWLINITINIFFFVLIIFVVASIIIIIGRFYATDA